VNILIAGDSWTYGYGIDDKTKIWPHVLSENLNSTYILAAKSGASNQEIFQESVSIIEQQKQKLDIVIIGWSGISRIIQNISNHFYSFCLSYDPNEDTDVRRKWFDEHSLQFLFDKWEKEITDIYDLCSKYSIKMVNFSVFGDRFPINVSTTLDISFMEFLSKSDGYTFEYKIPLFEFDFLHEKNITAKKFLSTYLNRDWELACAEREIWYGRTKVLQNGHPTVESHKLWANYLTKKVKEIYD